MSKFSSPQRKFASTLAHGVALKYFEEMSIRIAFIPFNKRDHACVKLDAECSRRIGTIYETLPVIGSDTKTQRAYSCLIDEVDMQYQFAIQKGITFIHQTGDPYQEASSPSLAMTRDVQEHHRLFVYRGGDDHPYLGSSTRDANGLTANDKFRAVHDLFAHAAEGNSFGPVGEERAWLVHARMFSPLSRRALASETRGQNSWVNFGPHMFNDFGWRGDPTNPDYLHPSERPYAEQKAALLPTHFDCSELRDDKPSIINFSNNTLELLHNATGLEELYARIST